ncbi:hypothetical protein JCM19046_3223 [Bacillus sp. JCM 19046]|uniref:Uncharacterized protein n=1 Tax=Shouchella xiaoxiensis TaxID=766895 RepID=A0ABS2SR08_9BACI|nr:DUF5342 family protein [Shouchella xiaoxiensis]MBM7837953.1 hypothetical protein [Shouchella xiaoxiensis]GAF12255.1 hypothetical protein JCM19045_1424 [Bacillus sp. JCM 19045]GAF18638.1 hypothetical protein JCM19046_3223 [Bacillus sp. JCM 19046]
MIVHFQYKPLTVLGRKQKWAFSCYYEGSFVSGTYHHNGDILWQSGPHEPEKQKFLKEAIHDLMLYHVYESEHQPNV